MEHINMLLINRFYRLTRLIFLTIVVMMSQYSLAFDMSQAEVEAHYKSILIDPVSATKSAKALYQKAKKAKNIHNELRYLYLYTIGESYSKAGDKQIRLVKKGLKLAESLNDNRYLADFYAIRSRIYAAQGVSNKARASIQKAISLSSTVGNKKRAFTFKLQLAQILLNQYNTGRTLQLISKSYQYFESKGLKFEMSLALKQFARVYDSNQQWDKAIEYYVKSIALNGLGDMAYSTALIQVDIAKAYQALSNFDASTEHLDKALQVFELLQLTQKKGEVYLYKAKNEAKQLHFDQAVNWYNKAVNSSDKPNNYTTVFNAHIGLSFTYVELNDFINAQLHLKRAKALLKKLEGASFKIRLLEADKYYHAKRGGFKKAYELYQQLEQLKGEYKEGRNQKVLHKLQANFDGEIKQKENELLLNENKLQKAIIAEQDLSIYLQVTLLIFFCVVISFMFYIQIKTKRNNKVLLKLALTDNLTGVANRRSIMLIAADEFERAKRYKHALTLGVIDLDFFKRVNDLYGHGEGDEVLKSFCTITKNSLRLQDKVGRFGGEEFLIIFPHTQMSEIKVLIKRIREQLRNYELPDPDHKVTFSIGVSQILADDETVDDMVKRADVALYKAKDNGRDCLVESG